MEDSCRDQKMDMKKPLCVLALVIATVAPANADGCTTMFILGLAAGIVQGCPNKTGNLRCERTEKNPDNHSRP